MQLMQKIHMLADVIVAYSADVLGYIAVYANDMQTKVAYITLFAIKPDYQRCGIGYRLLKEAELIAIQRGLSRIRLEVQKSNIKAIQFYRKNGFSEEGETPDSWYMIKDLETV